MTKNRILPYTAMGFVTLLWGLSFLSIKVAVVVLGPMTLALSRFIIASILLTGILKFLEPNSKLDKKDIPLMALSGIVGVTAYFFFENNGVKLTTASTASIIIATIPVVTIIADFIFCGYKITWNKGIGVILSFLGVYMIVRDSGQLTLESKYFIGNLFMLGAALAWVSYSLLTRPLGKKYSRLAITTYQTLFGTLAIAPFTLFEKNNWGAIDHTIVWNIVFLGVFCSALGYYIYVHSIGALGVDVTSMFINFVPVVTVVSSFFILGEKITSAQLTGGGLIIASVYLADMKSWFKKKTIIEPNLKY